MNKCLFVLDRALEIDQKNDCTQLWHGKALCVLVLFSEGWLTIRQLSHLKAYPDSPLAGVPCSPSRAYGRVLLSQQLFPI